MLKWSDIFVDASELRGIPLLQQWPNTVRGRVALIGASVFGDLFFTRPEGVVERLDVLEGGTDRVSATFEEFTRFVNNPEWQELMLLTQGVALLVERGIPRGNQQFYGFAPHPSLAGRIDWAQVMSLDAKVWHSICAQILDVPRPNETNTGVR